MFTIVQTISSSGETFDSSKFVEAGQVISSIGSAIEIAAMALDASGLEPIGVALEVVGEIIQVVSITIDLSQKIQKVNQLMNKFTDACNSVLKAIQFVETQINSINQYFNNLNQILGEFGKSVSGGNPDVIAQNFVDLQNAFDEIYPIYTAIASALGIPSIQAEKLQFFSTKPGYGSICRAVFIFVLYAKDHIPDNQISTFLQQTLGAHHLIPSTGLTKLVNAIEFTKKSLK